MLGVSTKVDCYGLSKYVVNNATYRRYLALYALMLPTSSETVITKCAPFGGVGANGPLEAMFIQIGPQVWQRAACESYNTEAAGWRLSNLRMCNASLSRRTGQQPQ
eukprot:9347841-Pyramimonas_sp.AAC.1